ncbi:hypothetical protein TNCV_1440681 [Trichonephila clavipes]|nr:hypothetical protein TNCV_1440681 [Trichonephila clavipes]
MGSSQEVGVSRRSDYTNELSCSSACSSVDTSLLRRVYSSIPRRAQAYLDIHGGHFDQGVATTVSIIRGS